ncbi:hypothetical protein HID58_088270, partial [Brassica napus]
MSSAGASTYSYSSWSSTKHELFFCYFTTGGLKTCCTEIAKDPKTDHEAVMEGLTSDSTNNVYNVNCAAEETKIKFDHKLKRKLRNEIKRGPLCKQAVEEYVENDWEDLGKSLVVDNKRISDDPSLNGTPLMNPILLGQDGLLQLRNLLQNYLMIAEKSR